MEKKSLVNVRGLAVIAVVLIHITAGGVVRGSFDGPINLFFNTISRFAVPIFFICSGYGTSIIYPRYKNGLEFIFSRFKLVPWFLFWSLFYALASNPPHNIKQLAIFIIIVLSGRSYYHMYFIPALLLCYCIYPLINKLSKTYLLISLILIGLFFQTLNYLEFNLVYFELFGFSLYFIFGVLIQRNKKMLEWLIKYKSFILLIGIIIIFTNVFYLYFYSQKSIELTASSLKPSVFIYAIGCFIFIATRFSNPNNFLNKLNNNSMTIYCIHPIILIINSKIIEKVGLISSSLIVIIVNLFVTVLLSYFMAIIIDKGMEVIKHFLNKIISVKNN